MVAASEVVSLVLGSEDVEVTVEVGSGSSGRVDMLGLVTWMAGLSGQESGCVLLEL
jgi:hypothetical protein